MRKIVMRTRLTAAILVAPLLGIFGCGGYSSPSPTGPDGLPSAPQGAVVINIVRDNGAQSFSPNPATIPAGQMVSWHNGDSIVHRVVLDNGRLDTGNISPGNFSAAMTLSAAGGYHCSIHPTMVGTLVTGQ
jgi:plastocyanin